MKTLKQLIGKSYQFYTTKHMRHQWVRKTYELEMSGKHARLTGGWGNAKEQGQAA